MKRIVVVDYGSGNLKSVSKALEAVAGKDESVAVSSDPAAVRSADRIVLPGQGAMGDCMKHLNESGLREEVLRAFSEKPVFAVCIGLQMLFEESEEGNSLGLGVFRGSQVSADRHENRVRRPAQGARNGLEPRLPDPFPSALGRHRGRLVVLPRAQLLRGA